jgi:hypothetical protein
LISDGDVQLECMGSNNCGELGLGVSDSDDHPVLKPATALAGIPISSVAVGDSVTCVLTAPSRGNQVYCFGDGSFGLLGNGKWNNSVMPVAVQGLRQSPRASSNCLLVTTKHVYCMLPQQQAQSLQCSAGVAIATRLLTLWIQQVLRILLKIHVLTHVCS